MPKLKLRRIRMKELRTMSLKNGWSEVDFYVRVKPRPKPEPTTQQPQTAGDYLDMQFSPVALWMSGGAVKGVCSFSETEWHVLKALVEAGPDGVEYGELIGTVPGWDVEYTDDGTVKTTLGRIKEKLDKKKLPFSVTTRTKRNENGIKNAYAFVGNP